MKPLRDTIGLRLALVSAAAAVFATLAAVALDAYWRATYRDESAARIVALQIVAFREAIAAVGGAAALSPAVEGKPLGFSAEPPPGPVRPWPGPWIARNVRAALNEPDAAIEARHVPFSSRPLWIRFEAEGRDWWLQLAVAPEGRPRPILLFVLVSAGLAAGGLAAGWFLIVRPLRRLRDAVVATDAEAPRVVAAIGGHGPAEIVEVSDAFTGLLDRLGEQRRDRDFALAAISHDLRAPLSRLRMRLELEAPDGLRAPAIADVMHVDRVLGQFLAYVRGGEAPAGAPIPGADLMEGLAVRRQGQGVSFAIAAPDLPAIPSDLFDRVAGNLIDNALAHGRPPVDVRLIADGAAVVLEVVDSGPGIDPGDVAAALAPFVRLRPGRGGDGHSGLGLATVRRLLAGSGGELSLARRDGRFVARARFAPPTDGAA